MGISSSNPDLFKAILAMNSYNRGSIAVIALIATSVLTLRKGSATIGLNFIEIGAQP
jgi:hypothetical protein